MVMRSGTVKEKVDMVATLPMLRSPSAPCSNRHEKNKESAHREGSSSSTGRSHEPQDDPASSCNEAEGFKNHREPLVKR